MPSLKDAISYLYGLEKGGIKPGLERIKRLLGLLGNPHRQYPSVLVAGTNGKGSTARMLSAILEEAGYRTALYTSPHILRFNERISVAGSEIDSKELASLIWRIKELVEKEMKDCPPTFFEFSTALAFEYFRTKRARIAVVEVGMGGRYDATNVLTPLVAVITTVGLDHTEYLGDTIEKIAFQKAGIIKRGVRVVTAVDNRRAMEVIERVSRARRATLYSYGRDFVVEESAGRLLYRGENTIDGIRPALKGGFQLKNTGCAIKVVELLRDMGYEVSKEAITEGLGKVRWPARFQLIGSRPAVILDCAHNPQGARALVDALKREGRNGCIMVTGMMRDKDVDAIMEALSEVAHTVICTRPVYWRSEEPERLKRAVERYRRRAVVRKRVWQAVAEALKMADKHDTVCITGSVFTVAEAVRFLKRKGYIREL